MSGPRTYSELFFSTAFDAVKNIGTLSTDFVMYLTARVLLKGPELAGNPEKLFSIVSLYYPDNTMKKSSYYKEVRKNFSHGIIPEKYKQLVLYSENIQAMISRMKHEGSQKNLDELLSLLMNHILDDEAMARIMTIDAIETGYTIDYYGFLFLKLIQDLELRSSSIKDSLAKINMTYRNMPISEFISSTTTQTVLAYLGCVVAEDLTSISSEILAKANILDYETFVNEIEFLQGDLKDVIISKTNDAISNLSERNQSILLYKYGFQDACEHTLEEVGTKYGLTRERVRQIESRSIQILSNSLNCISKNIKYMISQLIEKKGFATFEQLNTYLENDIIANYILISLPYINGISVNIDFKSHLIIHLGEQSLEEIEESHVCSMGNIINREMHNNLNEFQMYLINKYYNFKKGIYLRKGLNATFLLDAVIRDVLPNGYHNGSIEDFEKVITEGKDRYGDEFDYVTEHAMMAVLQRADYILVDRGLYKNRELCSDITLELLTKIIDYISSNLPIVFYSAIFNKFDKELNKLGITNQYYLKGVLDDKLPEDMHTKRDYITAEKGLTSQAAILQKMNSYHDVFTINDLRRAFPTTKDYIFNSIMYTHNEFINLYRGRYINYKSLNLNVDSIQEIKSVIDKTLSMSSVTFVTDRKVFARLKLFHKGLFSKMNYIDNHFALFSLIQYLFSDEYCLRRPFISIEDNELLGAEAIYADYVSKLDEFDPSVIHNYANKLNMRGVYSYLEFMDMMSDEFVQVSMDKMVKKKCLNLTIENLHMIRSVVEAAIKFSGEIDSRTFRGYSMFPKISYPWNKYLLTGIVRTYFDEFSIENTDNFTHRTDFIIRKNNIE